MIKYVEKIVLGKFNLKNNLLSTLTLHFDSIKHFIEFIIS
jgi:hypothetical protein